MSATHSPTRTAGLRDVGVVAVTKALLLVCGIGVQACLARLLGPDGRGQFAVCLTFAGVLSAACLLGAERGVQVFAVNRRIRRIEAVGLLGLIGTLAFVPLAAVGYLLIISKLPYFQKAPTTTFLIALAAVLPWAISDGLRWLMTGLRHFVYTGVVQVAGAMCYLVGAVTSMYFAGMGVNGALVAFAFAAVIQCVLLPLPLRPWQAVRELVPRMRSLRGTVSYGLRFVVGRLGWSTGEAAPIFVLGWFAKEGEIGLFAAAWALVTRIRLIPESLDVALLPRLGESDEGRTDLVAQSCRVLLAFLTAFLGTIVLLADFVVWLLYGHEFAACAPLMGIFAIGFGLRSAAVPLQTYFLAVHRPGLLSWEISTQFVLNVTLLILLYPIAGVVGAAWAMSISRGVGGVILIVAYRIISGQKLRDTWMLRWSDVLAIRHATTNLLQRMLGKGGR